MRALADSAQSLMAADARTRQNLELGQDLMAADVIFSDGRHIIEAMTARLRDLQAAEHASHLVELAALARQRWIAFGATALLWVAGLLALATVPSTTKAPAARGRTTEVSPPVSTQPTEEERSRTEQGPALDLASVAGLCTDLSRVTATEALPDLLGRAARVLDASGVVLWISAGDQLFPVMGHGYGQDVLARLAPVACGAENAAAAAWRTGQMTVVAAPGPASNGAIVAPLIGLDACLGVLAAEVRHGAEYNPATQAVATMIAAQLATVAPAWPAASVTQRAGTTPGVEEPPPPGKATLEARSA